MNTRAQGKIGETTAADFLRSKNFRILEQNYTTPRGELDIIAEDPDGTLVFVEVKTATTDSAGDPAAWVNGKKQKQLGRVATYYLVQRGLSEVKCRFDVVTVMMMGEKPEIRHYENAFMLTQGPAFYWP